MLIMGALAFTVGGRPEKIGTGAYILAWLGTLAVHTYFPTRGIQWGMLAMDSAALIVFGALVWKSKRSWPVWACALQLLIVASHVMLIAYLPTPMLSFYTVVNLTAYGILIAIGFGIFFAWHEKRMAEMATRRTDDDLIGL